MEEEGGAFEFKNVGHQYCAAVAANLIMLSHGCVMGWASPGLSLLASEDTPLLDGPLTKEEISWLGSISNIGALFGILTYGFIITSFLGCKRAMLFLGIPSISFWLFIYFGQTYYHIFIARFLAGWTGGGIYTTTIIYVSEIANDNIRGKLGTLTTTARNFGVLMIFSVGAAVDYQYIPIIFVSLPILYLVCFMSLPNTPQFYLEKEQVQKAEAALKFYKGYQGKSEMENIAIKIEFERLKALAKKNKEDEKLHLKDFDTKAIKGILFGIALGWWIQFPGCAAFLNYAVIIFEKIGAPSMDPHMSSIMLAIAQIFGGLASAPLADTVGRRLLMIFSFLGSAIGLFVLSLYLYLNQNGYDLTQYSFIPVASLSFIMFIASAGVLSLFSVCFVESFSKKVRTVGLTICILFLYTSGFIFVKLFPILMHEIDLYGCTTIFMIGSLIGTLFIVFTLEEKKGTSLDSVQSPENK